MTMGVIPCACSSVVRRAVVILTLVSVISGTCLLSPFEAEAKTTQDASADSESTQPADEVTGPLESSSQDAPYTFYTPFVTKGESEPKESLFGVQMYGRTGSDGNWADPLLGSGADYIRVAVNWESIEPENTTPDKFKWAHSDLVLGAARDFGLTIIATHDFQPYWAASQSKGRLDRAPLSELQQYFGALVERYDGDGYEDAPGSTVVRYWELYNEPDNASLGVGGGWGDYGKEYAQMLKAIYPVIKMADPHAKVLFGGVLMDNYRGEDESGLFVESFVDDVLAAGGGRYFDIMNIHTYVGPWSRHFPALGIVEKTEEVREKLAKYGLSKPIVLTETGWHSNEWPDGCDENNEACLYSSPEIQASYVPQVYASGIEAGLQTVIWWMLYNPTGDYPFENGLVTNDIPAVEKPAFAAYQAAVNMMQYTRFVRKLTPEQTGSTDVEVIQLYDSYEKRTVFVAWLPFSSEDFLPANASKTKETQTIELPVSAATVYGMYGDFVTTVADGDDGSVDGHITVTDVGTAAKYIVRDQ